MYRICGRMTEFSNYILQKKCNQVSMFFDSKERSIEEYTLSKHCVNNKKKENLDYAVPIL